MDKKTAEVIDDIYENIFDIDVILANRADKDQRLIGSDRWNYEKCQSHNDERQLRQVLLLEKIANELDVIARVLVDNALGSKRIEA